MYKAFDNLMIRCAKNDTFDPVMFKELAHSVDDFAREKAVEEEEEDQADWDNLDRIDSVRLVLSDYLPALNHCYLNTPVDEEDAILFCNAVRVEWKDEKDAIRQMFRYLETIWTDIRQRIVSYVRSIGMEEIIF